MRGSRSLCDLACSFTDLPTLLCSLSILCAYFFRFTSSGDDKLFAMYIPDLAAPCFLNRLVCSSYYMQKRKNDVNIIVPIVIILKIFFTEMGVRTLPVSVAVEFEKNWYFYVAVDCYYYYYQMAFAWPGTASLQLNDWWTPLLHQVFSV